MFLFSSKMFFRSGKNEIFLSIKALHTEWVAYMSRDFSDWIGLTTEWVEFELPGKYFVTEVVLTNDNTAGGPADGRFLAFLRNNMRGAKVFVDDKLCGTTAYNGRNRGKRVVFPGGPLISLIILCKILEQSSWVRE